MEEVKARTDGDKYAIQYKPGNRMRSKAMGREWAKLTYNTLP